MEKCCENMLPRGSKLGRTKRVLVVGIISAKNVILIYQEKKWAPRFNNKNSALKWIHYKDIYIGTAVEGGQDADEETNWKRKVVIIIYRWENMLEILTGESSIGYKN